MASAGTRTERYRLSFAGVEEFAEVLGIASDRYHEGMNVLGKALATVGPAIELRSLGGWVSLDTPNVGPLGGPIVKLRRTTDLVGEHRMDVQQHDVRAWRILGTAETVHPRWGRRSLFETALGFSVDYEDYSVGSDYSLIKLHRFGDWWTELGTDRNVENDAFAELRDRDPDAYHAGGYATLIAATSITPALRSGDEATITGAIDRALHGMAQVRDSSDVLQGLRELRVVTTARAATTTRGAGGAAASAAALRELGVVVGETGVVAEGTSVLARFGVKLKPVAGALGVAGTVAGGYVLVADADELTDGDLGADDVGYWCNAVGLAATVGAVAVGTSATILGAPAVAILGAVAGVGATASIICGFIDDPDPKEQFDNEIRLLAGYLSGTTVAPLPDEVGYEQYVADWRRLVEAGIIAPTDENTPSGVPNAPVRM